MPIDNPVKVVVSVLDPKELSIQVKLVRVPAQLPLKTCKTASDSVVGVTETICEVAVATKRYHTSSSAVPVHPVCDWVVFQVVPAVVVVQIKVGFTVRAIAPEQLSLAGIANVVPEPISGATVLYTGPPVHPVLL